MFWGIIKKRDKKCLKLESGNFLYYKSKENEILDGAGFIVTGKYINKVKRYIEIAGRVGLIIIDINKNINLKIIQVPTTSQEDEELEEFHD